MTLAGLEVIARINGKRGPSEQLRAFFWVIFFALLPDLIDKPLAVFFVPDPPSTRLIAHTLIFNLALWGALMISTPALSVWCLGVFFHLLMDQMWKHPHTLFFPFLGWQWDEVHLPELSLWYLIFWSWQRYTSELHKLIPELLGALVLVGALGRNVLGRFRTPP